MFYEYTLGIIEEYKHELILNTDDLYNSGLEAEVTNFHTFYEEMFLKEDNKIKYMQFRLK